MLNDMANHTVILLLDHVRAKRPYIRTVSKWVQELGLRGAFIFQWKLILLLLQGQTEDIMVQLVQSCTDPAYVILHSGVSIPPSDTVY
ncbi:RWD domain-containing protein 3-like isoform X3 [Cryptotermes secundus]|uniref:RWD domain-containing protein 3-like isoform X3 n=1 Tax=Cryptotermes secundus TaxID=105785 RepID=UPI000CD7DE92|nr:RWD domain-containing protein 3-like isoform X3 [Cryptotermes secundus]